MYGNYNLNNNSIYSDPTAFTTYTTYMNGLSKENEDRVFGGFGRIGGFGRFGGFGRPFGRPFGFGAPFLLGAATGAALNPYYGYGYPYYPSYPYYY